MGGEIVKEFVPRGYQRYAIHFIEEHPACALFLDMGMGKTAITLFAIRSLMYDSYDVKRVLVIAPLRVAASTWQDEAREWEGLSDLSIVSCLGTEGQRRAALRQRADIYTINRENIPWLVQYYGRCWPFDMVVIDESSSFKSPKARRFKELRRVRPLMHRIVELTGTPAPNGMMDLWSQIYLLDLGKRLGHTIGEYRRRWFTPGAGAGYVTYTWNEKKGARKEISDAIGDICVSMKAKDYIDLPPVLPNIIRVRLSEAKMRAYKKFEREQVLSLADEEIAATSAAVLSNKLLQFTSGAIYDAEGKTWKIHRAKLDALQDVIDANTGKPVMVFYWFRHELDRLKVEFPQARTLDGPQDIRDWNAGKIPLLLVHPASAGHGLNLQHGGSIIVWYSLSWSLELYEQANKRLHRSGQTHTVVIHHLVAQGTIDEDIMQSLADKRQGQDSMMEAVKARIREYGGKRL